SGAPGGPRGASSGGGGGLRTRGRGCTRGREGGGMLVGAGSQHSCRRASPSGGVRARGAAPAVCARRSGVVDAQRGGCGGEREQERKVFTIGFNATEGRHDNAFYDLLASEARLASFIAIAKSDVAQEHWFRMGRQLTAIDGGRALISWTGTMFEYLMPLLVMRNYRETLLGETYEAVIARQIEYGYERGVPWGISESAYAARDLHLNYQYGP